jgi:hypothetical protein
MTHLEAHREPSAVTTACGITWTTAKLPPPAALTLELKGVTCHRCQRSREAVSIRVRESLK